MKKIFSFFVAFMLLFTSFISAAGVEGLEKDKVIDNKNKKIEIIEKFQMKSGADFNILWNEEKGIPNFITGKLSDKSIGNASDAAAFITENKGLFELKDGSFINKSKESDALGMTHYRNKFVINGIPVYGTEIIVHTDKAGTVYAINGDVGKDIPAKAWNKEFKISSAIALKNAEKALKLDSKVQYTDKPTIEPYIYNNDGNWVAAYLVTTRFMSPYPGNVKTFVNARTGEIISSRNEIMTTATTGTGVGLSGTKTLNLDLVSGRYYMRDLTRGARIETYNANYTSSVPGTIVSDTDNNFNASSQMDAVDAHYNTTRVYDYYKNNFNRNSFDNNGATMRSTVLYRESSGTPYDNAFWNGSQMVYGDGSGTYFKHIPAALDVIAHEITHAVTSYTSNLNYENQSGALNESFSDVFGYFIEGDPTDWNCGEDCWTPNTPGDALRSLSDPTLYDQPAHMNNYQNLPNTEAGDWGGVHTNSGITNKAFYLAATSVNDNAKLQQVYYRALTSYLTPTSQFIDAKNALVQAANDLYPGTTIAQNITNAFAQVGIGSSTPPATDTYEPNNSTSAAYGSLTSGTVYNSYIYSSTDVDYYYFNTSASGNITINLSNLAGDYDLYLYNSAGTQVAKSENGSTTAETISYTGTAAGKFYIRVVGYSGAYSTSKAYALKATYPNSTPPSGQWYYENILISSPHNYTNNYNASKTYTKTGATKVSLHFSKLATESGYDFVTVKDKNGNVIGKYSGTKSPFTVEVPGDTAVITLTSDYSVTGYGYDIDQEGYFK